MCFATACHHSVWTLNWKTICAPPNVNCVRIVLHKNFNKQSSRRDTNQFCITWSPIAASQQIFTFNINNNIRNENFARMISSRPTANDCAADDHASMMPLYISTYRSNDISVSLLLLFSIRNYLLTNRESTPNANFNLCGSNEITRFTS